MVRKAVLKQRGHILLEATIAMVLLIALATYLLYTTTSAFSGMTFAAYCAVADNVLENEVAYVRAADIQADGSVRLPSASLAPEYTVSENTRENVEMFGPSSNYKGTLSVSRKLVDTLGGGTLSDQKRIWEYTVKVQFNYPSMSGANPLRFQKSRTVRKVAEG